MTVSPDITFALPAIPGGLEDLIVSYDPSAGIIELAFLDDRCNLVQAGRINVHLKPQ